MRRVEIISLEKAQVESHYRHDPSGKVSFVNEYQRRDAALKASVDKLARQSKTLSRDKAEKTVQFLKTLLVGADAALWLTVISQIVHLYKSAQSAGIPLEKARRMK